MMVVHDDRLYKNGVLGQAGYINTSE